MTAPPAGEQPAASPLGWTLPKGWTNVPPTGMRVATFKPAGSGKVDVSVITLSGNAGGELANVNRWRGQIGLAPVEEKALPGLRQTVKSKAGQVAVFDFTGEGQPKPRMVVGLLTTADGNSWFIKMTGDVDPVGKAKPEFVTLMETLRLEKAK